MGTICFKVGDKLMGLFSKVQMAQIQESAKKSKQLAEAPKKKSVNAKSINAKVEAMSAKVLEHFKDSKAELISSVEELHDYITKMCEVGIGAIDTETTGLDRIQDTIVGFSLYYPGGVEVYIPCKHRIPIFEEPYKDQLTYEQIGPELQRLVDAKCKLIFANADFDLAMIFKDFKVDLNPITFYDVLLAWRVLKENESDNSLKGLYTKYVVKGTMDRMKFSDFFTPELFPYCKPSIAKLYAAADAKYTYDLFVWQLPYVTKDNPKCQKQHFEAIADLIWGVEMPLIGVTQNLHRRGLYLEQPVADRLREKYNSILEEEQANPRIELKKYMDNTKYATSVKSPFGEAECFNPNSTPHVQWVIYDLLKLDSKGKGRSTDKEVLSMFPIPLVKQILHYRSLKTLIGTFVEKMPNLALTAPDKKIHSSFNQIGADTGRYSSKSPNVQNIPSRNGDIRRMFRASPGYVMMSSDYS